MTTTLTSNFNSCGISIGDIIYLPKGNRTKKQEKFLSYIILYVRITSWNPCNDFTFLSKKIAGYINMDIVKVKEINSATTITIE